MKKRVRELLERVIGKQTLPKELSGDSNALWLKNLFVLDPAVGYDVWQKMVAQENKVHFFFPPDCELNKTQAALCSFHALLFDKKQPSKNRQQDIRPTSFLCANSRNRVIKFWKWAAFETVANQISMICEKNFEEHVITAKNFLTEKKLLNLLLFLEKWRKEQALLILPVGSTTIKIFTIKSSIRSPKRFCNAIAQTEKNFLSFWTSATKMIAAIAHCFFTTIKYWVTKKRSIQTRQLS